METRRRSRNCCVHYAIIETLTTPSERPSLFAPGPFFKHRLNLSRDWLIWAVSGREHLKIFKVWKWMKRNGNEKTKLKLRKKCTLSDNWNIYDPLEEVFFFADGPFFKHPVFLGPAFAFGCALLREPSSSSSAFALPFTLEWWVIQSWTVAWCFPQWCADPA